MSVSLRLRARRTADRTRRVLSRALAYPRFQCAVARRRRHGVGGSGGARPRIAFVFFDFHFGGIESWIGRLAHELRSAFECHFVATAVPEFRPAFRALGPCHFLPRMGPMLRYFERERIDLVQIHNERWPADVALAAGVPVIVERTDGPESCLRVPKYGLAHVLASSRGTAAMIARRWPRAAGRVTVVYNGVDLDRADRAPVEHPWPADRFVVGYVGRFAEPKNLGLLLDAAASAAAEAPGVVVALVGGDSVHPTAAPLEDDLRAHAASLALEVTFLGLRDDVYPLTRGFDVAACASTSEGVPNALLEAMACGKPVVATDVGQVRELVEHDVSGLLVPSGDRAALAAALVRLRRDPALCARLGAAGRRTVETRFSTRTAAATYAEIYCRLLEA